MAELTDLSSSSEGTRFAVRHEKVPSRRPRPPPMSQMDTHQTGRERSGLAENFNRVATSRKSRFEDIDVSIHHPVEAVLEANHRLRSGSEPPSESRIVEEAPHRFRHRTRVTGRNDESRIFVPDELDASPTGVDTTGTPAAMASTSVYGPPSCSDGMTNTSMTARPWARYAMAGKHDAVTNPRDAA